MCLSNMAFVPEISILRASAMSSVSVLLFDRSRELVNCRVDPCVACLTKGVLWSLKIFVDCHALSISRRYFPFFSLRFCFPGPKSCHSYEKHILYVIVQKTGISEACKVMFLNGIIVYTNQKTVYFAVYSSFPQLRIQNLWQITFLCTMEHASIFFEPRRWWEVVDLNNFACLVPLHVPTIYLDSEYFIMICKIYLAVKINIDNLFLIR